MTHLWTAGPEIAVQPTPDGRPGSFTWIGRMHPTADICNEWRVHTDWWQQEVWRNYFKLQTEDGLLCTIYHDLLADRWHLARVYD